MHVNWMLGKQNYCETVWHFQTVVCIQRLIQHNANNRISEPLLADRILCYLFWPSMIVWLQEHLGYGAFMRLVTYAAVLFVSLSGGALAQNSNSGGTNTGITKHEAPIGHRQPTLKTLPPNVLQQEQAPPPGYEKYDKRRLEICKGC